MKFRNLSKWDDTNSCVGLIYFAQLTGELLFTFSHNTYKPSVMHTGLLCNEALTTIKEIEAGNIKPPNLDHVLAELCENLAGDLVAQELSPLDIKSFGPTLKNPKVSLQEKSTTIRLLLNKLNLTNYKEKNESLLIKEITGQQDQNRIRSLTRTYITTLIATGHHPKHIEKAATKFFYYGKNRIGGPEAINDFLNIFRIEKINCTAIFRVSKIFKSIVDACNLFKIIITDTPEQHLAKISELNFSANSDIETYAIIEDVPGYDIHSIRGIAEKRLKLMSTLLTLFHHKENPNWSSDCILFNTKTSSYKKIPSTINPMQKCADSREDLASKKLKIFLTEFELERASFSKFLRSAQLHSLALSSNSEENQLLNLWISLESLIPTETKFDDDSNIEHLIKSTIPFLNINYIESITNNLVRDLLQWSPGTIKSALKNVTGKKFTEKLARILTLPQYAQNLAIIEGNIRDFHLLRDRLNYFKDLLKTPKNIKSALDKHEQRLSWQIRRIYRARNIIVHSGQTPSSTPQLIEHLHDYLDTILNGLVSLSSSPQISKSVSEGFKYTSMKYAIYLKSLETKDLAFDDQNIGTYAFCKIINE